MKRKTTKKYKRAVVFAVHKNETVGSYHFVRYSRSGNLNTAPVKRFRKWSLAKKFANAKAKEWGINAVFSS